MGSHFTEQKLTPLLNYRAKDHFLMPFNSLTILLSELRPPKRGQYDQDDYKLSPTDQERPV
jgi:hypothetical protein